MRRSFWTQVATLTLGALFTLMAAAPPAAAKYYRPVPDVQVYMACYLRVPGASTAYAFPAVKTNGLELFNQFRFFLLNRLEPLFPQHRDLTCLLDDTEELALKLRSEQGLSYEERPWPQGLPEDARPVFVEGKGNVPRHQAPMQAGFVACLKSHESGVFVTSTFPASTADYRRKIDADASARWGSAEYVDCKTRTTREEADRAVRGAYNVAPNAWPLPWAGSPQAPPAKIVTAPKPIAAPALTLKTDTGPQDAAKAWDEKVKKTLAAEAQKKVEMAARQAQSDAKLKADYEAFFAERRKQGRAQ